jgi:four helix bundle protein
MTENPKQTGTRNNERWQNNNKGGRGVENGKYRQEWQRQKGGERFSKTSQENRGLERAPENEPDKKAIQNFRDLKVWKLGKEIVIETYKVTRGFPSEELYGLTAQMRRAALSIPSNIGEGHSRRSARDYQRFLKISAGSCAELETQVEVAVELSYLKPSFCEVLMEKIEYETRMLRKLIGKLSESALRHPSSDIQEKERPPRPLQY